MSSTKQLRYLSSGEPVPHRQVPELGLFGGFESLDANRRYRHDVKDDAGKHIFHNPGQVISPREMIQFSKDGASGFTNGDDAVVAANVSRPLECVDIKFLKIKGEGWNLPEGSMLFHPFKESDGEAVVPIIGGIYVKGKKLSDEELDKLGIEYVKDEEGEHVKYTAFRQGGRGIILPGQFDVPAFKSEKGHMIPPKKQLDYVLDRCFNGGAAENERLTRAELDRRYAQDDMGLTKDEYDRRYFLYMYYENAVGNAALSTMVDGDLMKSPAIQFNGVGLDRYPYHGAKPDSRGRLDVSEDTVILETQDERERKSIERAGEDWLFVFSQRYDGAQGILADQDHEPVPDKPSGGLAETEAKRHIERDQLFWANGVIMSGVTFGYAKLIDKVELDKVVGPTRMACDVLTVTERVILDDTHRLNLVTHETDEQVSPYLRTFWERDYGADVTNEDARNRYLKRLSQTVGNNLGKILGMGFTVSKDQNTAANLSYYGGVLDTADFIRMANPFQCGSLIRCWLRDVKDVADAAGLSATQYRRSEHFKDFVNSMLGEQRGKLALKEIESILSKPRTDQFSGIGLDTLGRRPGLGLGAAQEPTDEGQGSEIDVSTYIETQILGKHWMQKMGFDKEIGDKEVTDAYKRDSRFAQYTKTFESARGKKDILMALDGKAGIVLMSPKGLLSTRKQITGYLREKLIEYRIFSSEPGFEAYSATPDSEVGDEKAELTRPNPEAARRRAEAAARKKERAKKRAKKQKRKKR